MQEEQIKDLINLYKEMIERYFVEIKMTRDSILHYTEEIDKLRKELKQQQAEGLFDEQVKEAEVCGSGGKPCKECQKTS